MKTKLLLSVLLLTTLLGRAAAEEQLRQIKGVVSDAADKKPLVGATVFIDPTQTQVKDYAPQGCVTDLDGRFIFTVPKSVKSLIVSYLGYENQTITLGESGEINILLKASENEMDAVVVTGYQKIEKRKLTSSIATVNVKDIQQIGVGTIDQMLSGQVAGMTATSVSGGPGAPSKMKIRSTVTLNGTADPLWVLDGIPLEGNELPKDWSAKENIDNLYNMSIAGLNPADIETITVLKDAAATAIYGARAANGVIVITSKRGTRGAPRVNASLSLFVNAAPNLDKLNLLNASQKVDMELGLASQPQFNYFKEFGSVSRILDKSGERAALISGGFGALSTDTQSAINKLRTQGSDWADEIYRMTINQQYSLSVSGGGEKSTYYFSTGYFNEQGATKGTGFDRFNITLKTDFDLRHNLKFGASMFASQNKNTSYLSDANVSANPSNYTRQVNPYNEMYNADGSYHYDEDVTAYANSSESKTKFNYLEERNNTNYELKARSVKAIFDLEYKPLRGLRFYTQVGLQADNSATVKEAQESSLFTRKYAQDAVVAGKTYLPKGGVIQNWNGDFLQYTWKLQGQFSRTFNNKHEIDLMAGMELRGVESRNIHTKGFGYDSKTLQTKPIVFPNTTAGQGKADSNLFRQYSNGFYENRYLSYFMTGSYSYDNRYTFFGSVRYDGTNLFGVDPKYRFNPIWSVSGAWNVMGEEFMSNVNWLSSLKFRASYGIQGNADRSTSPHILGTWGNTNIGGESEDVIGVASPPNPYLRWETTTSWNAAVDAGFLDNRINLTAEVYGRRSENLITNKDIPHETGFTSIKTNFGTISSQGVELTLRSENIRTKNFSWNTHFNIAHNTDKVVRTNLNPSQWTPSLEGYSSGAIFAIKTAGLDKNGHPMFWRDGEKVSMIDFFGFRVDHNVIIPVYWESYDPSFKNTVSDVRNSLSYIGNTNPKFTGGLNNQFRYKNFDLSVSANFVVGQKVSVQPFYNPAEINPGRNYTGAMGQVWTKENESGIYPTLVGSNKLNGSTWGEWSDWNQARAINYMYGQGYGISNIFSMLDIWTKEISYLRINSIRMGYTLPEKLIKKLRMSTARINVEVRNPFVIASNYDGYFDPESYGNIYSQPLARTFSIGLNIGF